MAGAGAGRSTAIPPQLPPRDSMSSSDAPPPYTPYAQGVFESGDPRTSSTQSLLPNDTPESADKRRLLLVYIHGFQGNETSFQSFPAHVHNLATITLAETHTVHTKIYPKYRTRRAIEYARDDFSAWLAPHESPNTDVVLLGHSMGGLLAAEVVLMPTDMPTARSPFQHHILGTINFDVPFLGMHPGVISSGLGSLFKPADKPTSPDGTAEEKQSIPERMSTLFKPPTDPHYNPAFANDVNLPIRKGWENTMHFLHKHKDNIFKSSKRLVASHMEFGGAMADYPSLKRRYQRIRPLEEEDKAKRTSMTEGPGAPPRVRFVNYYTASTGRPKKPKSPSRDAGQSSSSLNLTTTTTETSEPSKTESRSRDSNGPTKVQEDTSTSSAEHKSGQSLASSSGDHAQDLVSKTGRLALSSQPTAESSILSGLPPIPPEPEKPPAFDPAAYTNKDVLSFAERTHAREMTRYQQLAEDHQTALREREEVIQKLTQDKNKDSAHTTQARSRSTTPTPISTQKTLVGTAEPHPPHGQGDFSIEDGLRGEYEGSDTVSLETTTSNTSSFQNSDTNSSEQHPNKPSKPKRDKKFCMLPAKDARGLPDPTWVRVFMKGVDEVGAHCGLFFVSETYEQLVGDVAARVEEWVRDDMTRRLLEAYAS